MQQLRGDCGGEAAVHSIFASPEHQPQEAGGRRPHGLLCGESSSIAVYGRAGHPVVRAFAVVQIYGAISGHVNMAEQKCCHACRYAESR